MQVMQSGNGSISGTGVYLLRPFASNNINIGFNVMGPADATLYLPTGVNINGTACTIVH